MLNLEKIEKVDTSSMYKVYDEWPDIANQAFNSELEQIEFENIDNVVFAGMGGSGSIGDIFTSILSKAKIHSSTVKGYLLPNTINENSLVIVTSVSGNTVEVQNILKTSFTKKYKLICFSSGGIIEEYCKKNNIIHKHVEKIHSPRASFTRFLYSMLKILQPNIPIKNEEVLESINELKKLGLKINSSNISELNPSLNIANWISNVPVIYYPWGLQAAAIRFKNSLQENAKIHAMVEDVVEASHNGIVAWEKSSEFKPILIQGSDDNKNTKERWDIFKNYFNDRNIEFKEVQTQGKGILSKIVYLIYLLDYSSIYRSVLSQIDPTPVKSIDYIKLKLSKNDTIYEDLMDIK